MIDLAKNPTYAILDLGRTKSMGARHAVNKFMQAVLACGLECELTPPISKFSSATSATDSVHQAVRIWFSDETSCIHYCGYFGAWTCTALAVTPANEAPQYET